MMLLLRLAACSTWFVEDDGVEITVTNEVATPYREGGPDVVLIVLDTLRADHLSQAGYPLETSPGLDKLSERSVRFESAWAPSPWTVPSTTSILTGQHPLRHQLRRYGDVLSPDVNTLAERVRLAGWHTLAWSYNVSVAPRLGHAQGFDKFTKNTGRVLGYLPAGRMTQHAIDWVGTPRTEPSFLYLQPMNCHGPYRVPKADRKRLLGRPPDPRFVYYAGPMGRILKGSLLSARDRVDEAYLTSLREQYDTAIRYETDQIGLLIDALDDAGRLDGALVILTSDHGEELFEHGGFSHGYSLHQEVLHVPLWVKFPGQRTEVVVTDPVSTVDVTPTVLDVLGVSDTSLDGRSLAPYQAGSGALPPRPLLFDVHWPKRIVAQGVSDGGWKYLRIDHDYQGRRGTEELFDIVADPDELVELSGGEPARIASMRSLLEGLVGQFSGGVLPANVLSEMDREQLEALGYLE